MQRWERDARSVGRKATVCTLVLIALAEVAHWRAAHQVLVRRTLTADDNSEAILVLGYPSHAGGRLHPMQRWRTDIAVRSMRSPQTRLVLSGAARGGEPSEAEVMAAYARDVLGVPAAQIVVETRALTTWQNVQHCLPLIEDAATIKIASAPLHAARARRYLAQQRPDLAQRVASADDYRLGERCGWKLATLVYGLHRAVRPRIGRSRLARSSA